ncbi:hypothetical protein ASPZODRAFT_70729 [Penicilliopsis zonata CBS 506.65]|uniref:Uncharacterized protein n=1 Tax=Penicilliopsis zonata CBS 506.65 TaxID=1073090 RepID=A0A1L9SDE2_9EURO|nr:hypothetical protein ASPZODRAFT_70729 [Penicilliopsis zonata CBS 506.65]OJJ45133.1 hypothetical protein ASPZODRAFT_70729 [Penicilliopsis zonata CBS 506.65]
MPLQSRLDRLAHRLSSHKRSKTPSLRPAEQNLRSPPAPSSSVAAASPSSTSSNVSKSTSSATSLQLAGLWKEAYEKLRSEDEKLIHEYENALVQRWQPAGGDEGQNKREGGNDGTGSTDRNLQAIVEQRLQEISSSQLTLTVAGKEIVVKDQLRRVVRGILAVKDSVSVAVGADPHAALAWAGVLLLLTPVVRAATQDGDAADAFETMSSLLVRYRVIEEDGRIQAAPTALSRQATAMDTLATHIRSQIVHLYAAVLRFQMRLLKHFSRSGFVRLWEDVTVTDDWKEILETIKDLDKSIAMDLRVFNDHVLPSVKVKLDGLQEGLNKSLTLMVEARDEAKSAKQAQLLGSLSPAPNAAFNSFDDQHKSACLAGTQVELLQHIHAWCDSPGGKCIYWLKGMAGTGKSTISRTLAAACHDRLSLVAGETVPDHVRLGASFFFEQRKAEQNNARKLFTTICRQLADSLPDLRDDICQAISDHQNIANEAMSNQWKHLILQPLLALEKRTMVPLTLVVVIDALDECESSRDISTLLRLVAEAERLTTTLLRLKLFITSRPESHIRTSFLNLPDTAVGERELQKVQVHANGVKDDITLFLEHELSQIGRRYVLSDAWPGEEKTKRLALKSDGLFIYAATVCRFLGEQRSLTKARLQSRMEMIFDDRVSKGLPQQSLDTIYRNILQHSLFDEAVLDDEKEDTYDMFRCVVGAIVILLEPLSVTALANLLPYPERDQIDETLDGLYSLLSKGEEQANNEETSTVQLLHLSFRDFLLDEQRCGQEFWIDQQKVHRELLEYCMQAMCESLKRDVCELSDHSVLTLDVPLARVNCHLPPHVQYACQYWVEHLRNAKIQPLDDHGNSTSGSSIHAFLTKHLLHWLEAMILTRKMTEAVQALLDLLEYIFSLPSEGRIELRKFVHGARRFVLHFRPTIERAPLQLYVSALIYCPELSVVRAQFQDEIPKTFVGLPEVEKDWSPLLQTFEAHRSSFSGEVCLSPDGKLVVCASSLRLWDTATGALLKTYEPGGGPDAIATFSANGERLMSLCDDGYVRVWDVSPGLLVHETPGGHSAAVTRVAFSPDGTRLASLSEDNTICLWDPRTGTLAKEFHGSSFKDVIFSSDSRLLIYGEEDRRNAAQWLDIWDLMSDKLLHRIPNFHCVVLKLSPDGSLLTSVGEHGGYENVVEIWDMDSGTLRQSVQLPNDEYDPLAVSPDSELLLIERESTLELWDLATLDTIGKRSLQLEGHRLSFSADGRRIVTNYGRLDIRSFYPDWNGSDSRDLFVDGDWVISGTKRVLLLPHDYRPTVAVAVDDTLIIGHRSGFVTFLKLASVESQHDIP